MLLGGRCHSSGNTVTFYLRNGYSQCTQFLYRVHELAITFYPAVLEFEGMDVVVLAIALRIPRDQRLAAPVALDPEVVRILGLEDAGATDRPIRVAAALRSAVRVAIDRP